jgi:copper chaperone CopZ
MKKKINLILVIMVICVLAAAAFFVRPGITADQVVVLRTGGMTCGSCSDTITKALKRQRGVAVTEIDVEGGWVIASYDSKIVKPEALSDLVNKAGFNSRIQTVLTPDQFKNITGRSIGLQAAGGGCCGNKGGGCGSKKTN